MNDAWNSDDIDAAKAELVAAGWVAKTSTLWKSPTGSLHVGPAGAWRVMKRALNDDTHRMQTRPMSSLELTTSASFAAWEKERPEAFLKHAIVATSQYDAQYRSMAAEILALRAATAPQEGQMPRAKACTRCNHVTLMALKFCTKCGTWLDVSPLPPPPVAAHE